MLSSKVALAIVGVVAGVLITLTLFDGAVTRGLEGLLDRVTLPNVGTVKAIGVGVYWDTSCSDHVSSIDWGMVEPGTTKNVSFYTKNEGTTPVTLSLETENWNPANASIYMSLDWDYAGQEIDVDEVIQVTLSLSVSDSIGGITDFSFDIIIIGIS
jgi:hypothetical protein